MIMKGEERRAFTAAKLSLIHNFTVDCLTFAHFLLPSHTFNDFLGHHHHWMEWLGATIDINGFSMVLRSGNHWFQWFTMVFHHWSNDGMVAYHRWSLAHVLVQAQYTNGETRWTGKGCLECQNHEVSDTKHHLFVLYIWADHCPVL